jgi:hypothetical protein
MARAVPYTKGPTRWPTGVWAYLQPDGGWDRSYAGLFAGADGDTSMLVDTLFSGTDTDAGNRRWWGCPAAPSTWLA